MPASTSAGITPSGTISQANFDTYSNDWIAVVSNDDSTELGECFRLDGATENIKCVYFSTLQVAQLVSTVGAQNIKARFLVERQNINGTEYPHFALALFATDDLNGRLSAYYVSQPYWLLADGGPENTPVLDVYKPVLLPDALATYWQNNWSPAGEDPLATQEMFDSTYGYLRGYTFEMDDFLKPLMQIPPKMLIQNAAPIRINFGLHQYYPAIPNADGTLNNTFGLLVSYAGYPDSPDQNPIDEEEVFYDLGSPCPPKC
jgi:hypothetical protein